MNAETRTWIRKTLIRMALRRARPGAGTRWDLIQRRLTGMALPDLRVILDPLPWALVGALAARQYMPERATRDVDIAIRAVDAPEARRRLQAAGFRYMGDIPGSSWVSSEGLAIDVLELEAPWAEPALRLAQENRDAQGFPVMPLPSRAVGRGRAARIL